MASLARFAPLPGHNLETRWSWAATKGIESSDLQLQYKVVWDTRWFCSGRTISRQIKYLSATEL